MPKVKCTKILNAGEVSEARGCYNKNRCAGSADEISSGVFERMTLKGIIKAYGADVNAMKQAEAGGLLQFYFSFCFFNHYT